MLRAPPIEVAVAVVRDAAGRVLLAERTARQLAAGFWEAPGGKIDPGEDPAEAAARELREETGLIAQSLKPLMRYEHAFPARRVRLHVFAVERWRGLPQGREGQRLSWASPAAPSVGPILPSNDRLLRTLGLPDRLIVAEALRPQDGAACLDALAQSFAAGARLAQLRAPRLAPDQRVNLARRAVALAREYGARLMLAGSALEARRAGADGLHSTTDEARRMNARPCAGLWSLACRDAEDVARASGLGADFAVLSPTPARAPLDVGGLRAQATTSALPIYAEGEGGDADLANARRAGGISLLRLSQGP